MIIKIHLFFLQGTLYRKPQRLVCVGRGYVPSLLGLYDGVGGTLHKSRLKIYIGGVKCACLGGGTGVRVTLEYERL